MAESIKSETSIRGGKDELDIKEWARSAAEVDCVCRTCKCTSCPRVEAPCEESGVVGWTRKSDNKCICSICECRLCEQKPKTPKPKTVQIKAEGKTEIAPIGWAREQISSCSCTCCECPQCRSMMHMITEESPKTSGLERNLSEMWNLENCECGNEEDCTCNSFINEARKLEALRTSKTAQSTPSKVSKNTETGTLQSEMSVENINPNQETAKPPRPYVSETESQRYSN